MKTKLKISSVIFLLCFIFTIGFTSYASEISGYDSEIGEKGISENISDDVTEVHQSREENTKNPFALIYEEIMSHITEILSLFSLIGTLIISYFYKRGLLPSVKGVLGSMSTSVIKLKETSDSEIEARKNESEKIERRLDSFDSTLKEQSELISSLEARLISEEDIFRQREKSNLILSSQIDMLYEIFMSSSLPQFQKEAMGEKISKMRKELNCYEKT